MPLLTMRQLSSVEVSSEALDSEAMEVLVLGRVLLNLKDFRLANELFCKDETLLEVEDNELLENGYQFLSGIGC